MIAVREGWLARTCFLETVARILLRLTSFFGLVGSICDSYSWIRAFAISEQALMYRSFSGSSFSFFLGLACGGMVMVMVAILEEGLPHEGGRARRLKQQVSNQKPVSSSGDDGDGDGDGSGGAPRWSFEIDSVRSTAMQ